MARIEFFAFRHGETDWNKAKRFQGHSNIDLNATGISQAEGLAQKLKDYKIPLIVSSDLSRALRTAQIVTSVHPAKIITSDQLREAHLGVTEGVLLDDVIARHGEENWLRWIGSNPNDLDFGWPGGETKREQLSRMKKFLREFVLLHVKTNSHPVGISTHGGVLANLVLHAENGPKEVRVPNCGVYRLHYDVKEDLWIFLGEV